jgi:uncharacterized protein (TIGR02217 family)
MGAFDDVRLPVNVETGAIGGPTFSTTIVTMANGQEQRIQNWVRARSSYTISYDTSESDWPAVRAFFYARRGRARGFRFKDWTDYQAEGEAVLVDGSGNMLLSRSYSDDVGVAYARQITRIVPGTLKLYHADGTDVTAQYTERYGLLTGPAPVGTLYSDYEFDLPVRFDVDTFDLTAETILAASVGKLDVIELIEDSLKLNGR